MGKISKVDFGKCIIKLPNNHNTNKSPNRFGLFFNSTYATKKKIQNNTQITQLFCYNQVAF